MNGISQGEDELGEALERLATTWSNLRPEWDDEAQRYFETAYVAPALDTTARVLLQAQQLGALINQARGSVE
jgi:hypothetical protein